MARSRAIGWRTSFLRPKPRLRRDVPSSSRKRCDAAKADFKSMTGTARSMRSAGAPRMAEHRKRPRDPAQLAKLIVDIATGQVEDREPTPEEQGKDPAAGAVGFLPGTARRSIRAQAASVQTDSSIMLNMGVKYRNFRYL